MVIDNDGIDILVEIIEEQSDQIKKAAIGGFILGAVTVLGCTSGYKIVNFIKDKFIKNKKCE